VEHHGSREQGKRAASDRHEKQWRCVKGEREKGVGVKDELWYEDDV
jgi:hypothetical protein